MVLVPGGCKWSSCTHSQLLEHSWWLLEPARDHNSVVYLRKVPTNQGSTRMTQKMVKISQGREIGAAKMAQVGRPRKWILSQPWFFSRNLLECLLRSIVLLFTNVRCKNLLNRLLRELYLVQYTKIVWADSGKSLKKFQFGKKVEKIFDILILPAYLIQKGAWIIKKHTFRIQGHLQSEKRKKTKEITFLEF